MREGALQEKSFAFAVRIVKLRQYLSREKAEQAISKQLLRSGTAVGALVREAEQAESRADFVHKLSIALKEASETEYWILLLTEAGYLSAQEMESIAADNRELLKLLSSIINTTKKRMVR